MEAGKLVVSKELTYQGKLKEFTQGLEKVEDISLYEDNFFQSSSYYISGQLFDYWRLDARYVHILKGLDYEQSNPSPQIARWIDSLDVVRTAIVKNLDIKGENAKEKELEEFVSLANSDEVHSITDQAVFPIAQKEKNTLIKAMS
jgi:hypothetical protein